MKKIMSALLCLVMVLAMMPFTARDARADIDYIHLIGFEMPLAGHKAVDDDIIIEVGLYDETMVKATACWTYHGEPATVFEEGKTYCFDIISEPYELEETIADDRYIACEWDMEDMYFGYAGYLNIGGTFTVKKTIPSIEVSYTQPKAGAKITAPTVPAGSRYRLIDYMWEEYNGKEYKWLEAEDLKDGNHVFKSGCTYKLTCVKLLPDDGYVFDTSKSQWHEKDGTWYRDYMKSTGYIKMANVMCRNYLNLEEQETFVYCDYACLGTGAMIQLLKSTISATSYIYSGSAKKPAVSLGNLKKGTDYTVSYSNNTKVGKATVTIKGTGKYSGTIKKEFTIKPKKASVKTLTAGKKKLTVKLGGKVSSTGGSTYQIKYKVKGASKWKTVTTTSSSKTLKSLKKGKKYQVKVRAYKTVGGKKYYGAWSDVKTSGKIK